MPHISWPLLAGVLAFELYAFLAPRVPGIGDASEFTLALALAGAPHPTGYPLYTVLGSAFVHLLHAAGIGWVQAAGWWSALCAAIAVALFAGLMQQIARLVAPAQRAPLAGSLSVIILALHPVWLRAATEPEVYSGWFACIAGAAWFCLATVASLDAPPPHTPRLMRIGFVWGLITGVGFLQHALSLLFVGPLSLALLSGLMQRRMLRASFLPAFVGGLLLPLTSWAFIAWRAFHPAAYQWPLEPSLTAVWEHIRGAAYAGYLGGFAPNAAERTLLSGTLLPIVIPGLALTLFFAMRETRPALRSTLLALALGGALLLAFTLNYRVPDPAMYCVPVLMVSLLWLPVALSMARRVIAVLALVLIGSGMAWWGVTATLAHRVKLERIDARIRNAWHSIPFERGIVLWNDDHSARLVLLQLLEQDHPERLVVNPSRLTWPAERREITRRAGFDPLEGLLLRTTDDLVKVAPNIQRQTALPVIEFPSVLGREVPPR